LYIHYHALQDQYLAIHFGPGLSHPFQIINENICVQKGQEYRINDDNYKNNVKYHWLTCKDNSNIKIYFQQKPVNYADYKPFMYYISPFEIYL